MAKKKGVRQVPALREFSRGSKSTRINFFNRNLNSVNLDVIYFYLFFPRPYQICINLGSFGKESVLCSTLDLIFYHEILCAIKHNNNDTTSFSSIYCIEVIKYIKKVKPKFSIFFLIYTLPVLEKFSRIIFVFKCKDITYYHPISILRNFVKLFDSVLFDKLYPNIRHKISIFPLLQRITAQQVFCKDL